VGAHSSKGFWQHARSSREENKSSFHPLQTNTNQSKAKQSKANRRWTQAPPFQCVAQLLYKHLSAEKEREREREREERGERERER
jgi:hypothetical protein